MPCIWPTTRDFTRVQTLGLVRLLYAAMVACLKVSLSLPAKLTQKLSQSILLVKLAPTSMVQRCIPHWNRATTPVELVRALKPLSTQESHTLLLAFQTQIH
jgi:hypothetical protein